MIRLATTDDLEFLAKHDSHITREVIEQKIAGSHIYIAEIEAGQRAGWLRFGLFWDLIPFMNMLYVLEPYRGKGHGRQLVRCWEHDMRRQGFDLVLTSTQSDEEAQHFYRRLGYIDTGVLLLPAEPAEIILRKHILDSQEGRG